MKITEEQQKRLNDIFTPMEIKEALKHQKKGKNPGPYGIIVEYCDKLEEVMLTFKEVLEYIRMNKMIPYSWKESTITLIPNKSRIERSSKIIGQSHC